MKHALTLSAISILLVGCSSLSKKPQSVQTVQYEQPAQTIPVQTTSYASQENRSQGSLVCENDNMRANALDGDDSNDVARIVIVQDEAVGSNILHQVEVNCRDYFLRKSVYNSEPQIIQSSNRVIATEVVEEPRQIIQSSTRRNYHTVRSGDTVWTIARNNCTTVEAISRLNDLGSGNHIDIDKRLELPEPDC